MLFVNSKYCRSGTHQGEVDSYWLTLNCAHFFCSCEIMKAQNFILCAFEMARKFLLISWWHVEYLHAKNAFSPFLLYLEIQKESQLIFVSTSDLFYRHWLEISHWFPHWRLNWVDCIDFQLTCSDGFEENIYKNILENVFSFRSNRFLCQKIKKPILQDDGYWKGQCHEICYSGFFVGKLILAPLELSRKDFKIFEYSRSYSSLYSTPRCVHHQGVNYKWNNSKNIRKNS
jgi:hypothetical protein